MIEDIAGTAGIMPPPPPPPPPRGGGLSEDDQATIEEILSQYDSSNLSQDDAQAINDALGESGITPTFELAQMMTEAGFDPASMAEAGNSSGYQPQTDGFGPPPPPPGAGPDSDALNLFSELLNQESDGGNASQDTLTDILTQMAAQGMTGTGGHVMDFAV